jgi:hypothetical protein
MPHNTERLGDLIDSLVPVLVERLHETGLGEIEIERDGAIVRVRAEDLGAPVVAAPAPAPLSDRHLEDRPSIAATAARTSSPSMEGRMEGT